MGRSGVLVLGPLAGRPLKSRRLSFRPLVVLIAVLTMVLSLAGVSSLTAVSSAQAASATRTLITDAGTVTAVTGTYDVTSNASAGRVISTSTPVGQISGTVTDLGRGRLAGVQVNVSSDALPDRMNAAKTAPDGSYLVTGLPVGTDYRVCFTAAGATGGSSDVVGYLGRCYDSRPIRGSSTPVSVPLDATRTGINAVLAVGGAISGTVTESGGGQHGLSNISVSVRSRSTSASWSAGTAADGSYTVTGLPAGDDYRVCFTAAGARGGGSDGLGYLDRCHDNQPPSGTPASGTPTSVTVKLGATRTGINAVLVVGGAVSGTVTEAGGTQHGLADVLVQVSSPSTGAGRSATTAADGSYTVTGLSAGTDYTVCFAPSGATGGSSDASGYLERCWKNQPISGAPTPVSVALGSTRTGISAVLAVGGAVSGTVTDAAGTHHGLANVGVNVGSTSTWGSGYAVTADNGSYTVRGLPAGTDYTVCFFPSEATGGSSDASEYLGECYDSKHISDAPTPVKVTLGATRVLNTALVGAGAISGTVTDGGGAHHGAQHGLSNVSVSVESTSTGAFGYARTAADGGYTVAGLAVGGDYRVCFTAIGARGGDSDALGYLGQCWQNRLISGTPTPVAATLGATRAGVNAALVTAGAVSGRVTDARGNHHGLADVSVHVSSASLGIDEFASTAADGSYTVQGLLAGADYTVCFIALGATGGASHVPGYVDRCWQNQPGPDASTPVTVTLGKTKSAINAVLVGN